MKKKICLLLSTLIIFSFSVIGCGESAKEDNSSKENVENTESLKSREKDESTIIKFEELLTNEAMEHKVEYSEKEGSFIITYTSPKAFLDAIKGEKFDVIRENGFKYDKYKNCMIEQGTDDRSLLINLKAEGDDEVYYQMKNGEVTMDKMK